MRKYTAVRTYCMYDDGAGCISNSNDTHLIHITTCISVYPFIYFIFIFHFCSALFHRTFLLLAFFFALHSTSSTHIQRYMHSSHSKRSIYYSFQVRIQIFMAFAPFGICSIISLSRSVSVCTGKKVKLISIKWAAVRCGERMRIISHRHEHTHDVLHGQALRILKIRIGRGRQQVVKWNGKNIENIHRSNGIHTVELNIKWKSQKWHSRHEAQHLFLSHFITRYTHCTRATA